VIGLQSILFVVFGLISSIVVFFATRDFALSILCFFLVGLQSCNSLMQAVMQSVKKIMYQFALTAIQSFAWIIGLLYLVWFFPGSAVGGIAAITFANALTAVAAGYLLFRMIGDSGPIDFVPSIKNLRKIFHFGLPMCFWFFAIQVFSIGDRLIYPFLGITNETGQYMTFRDIAVGITGFLTMPILMASHTSIMWGWKDGDGIAQVQDILSKSVELVLLLTFPVLIGVCLIGSDLMGLVFGGEYRTSALIMALVYSSIITMTLAMYFQKGLEVTGNTFLLAKLALGVACVFVVSSFISISYFGVIGGAATVFLSSAFYLMIVSIMSGSIVRPKFKKIFLIKLLIWSILVIGLDWIQITILSLESLNKAHIIYRLAVITVAGVMLCFSDRRFRLLLTRFI
jgi:O-antigen/teichoic acid export membrane protein